MKNLTKVNSSVIAEVGIDGDNLLLKFNTGTTYSIQNAANEYQGLMSAESVGVYYNSKIKRVYKSVIKLTDLEIK